MRKFRSGRSRSVVGKEDCYEKVPVEENGYVVSGRSSP